MPNGMSPGFPRSTDQVDQEDVAEERFRLLMKEGPDAPADSESPNLGLPSYYDAEKFHLGQQVFTNNLFTMMIAKLSGLLSLLAVPSILNILRLTKQSGTPCTAFRRYLATILHTCIWYQKAPDVQNEFFKSLKNVRRKHCLASRKSLEAGFQRISQLDMALTQFGFIGYTLLSGEKLGVAATKEELEGLVHVWRVIGNLLGMEERFNLCAGTVDQTRALCRRLLEEVFLPYFATDNKDFREMSNVLLEGLWCINPQIRPDSFYAFTLHLATSCAANNNHSIVIDTTSMPLYSRFLLALQIWILKNLLATSLWWSPIFRSFFNAQMRLSIFLSEKFPFLAYWMFGRSRSHVNIYKMHQE